MMNKKIEEMAKQCWSYTINGVLIDGHLHFDYEKFAELIVRECADIAALNQHQYDSVDNYVLRHFGVKK